MMPTTPQVHHLSKKIYTRHHRATQIEHIAMLELFQAGLNAEFRLNLIDVLKCHKILLDHIFFEKKHGLSERCNPCGKRIKFSKPYLKCRECETICHAECKLNVLLPCIAKVAKTPSSRPGNQKCLADFIPPGPPMVPGASGLAPKIDQLFKCGLFTALIDLCVKEIEARGLEESGIYRIPGNDSMASQLLEKLIQGKGAPPR